MSSKNVFSFPLATIILAILFLVPCTAQLSSTFYDTTCPNALATIRTTIRTAVAAERRIAASLIRLHFHDCFVQGCDGSILLDNSATIVSEQNSVANNGSVRGFNIIANAKTEVEKICPGIVSCADILAVAARDSSVAVSGPSWTVKLGRRDSTTASRSLADSDLPSAFSTLPGLISNFANKGFNAREMVALSGSHTLGQAQCRVFRRRIYNETNIDAGFATTRRRTCPPDTPNGNSNLAPLDLVTPNSFDNNYFKNLQQFKGLLTSDQVLFTGTGGSTDSIVNEFSATPATFSSAFAAAMVKMGDISPLTGTNGIIRRVCNVIN